MTIVEQGPACILLDLCPFLYIIMIQASEKFVHVCSSPPNNPLLFGWVLLAVAFMKFGKNLERAFWQGPKCSREVLNFQEICLLTLGRSINHCLWMTEADAINASGFVLWSIILPKSLDCGGLEMRCLLDLDSKEKFNLTGKTFRYFWLLSHQYANDT